MKILIAAALVLATCAPVLADDYSRIPADIRMQIKAKCLARYPDDYGTQHGCIIVQSDSYLAVQGYAPPARTLTTADGADFRNHAYLSVAAKICALKVDTMVHDYNVRGRMMNGDIPDSTANEYIASYVKQYKAEARKDRKKFCGEARANLPNFLADISQQLAE